MGISSPKSSFLQPLDLFTIRAAYDSVQLFATLVNNSVSLNVDKDNLAPEGICNGRTLMSLMANHSFDFPSGPLAFRSDGSRGADLLLHTFNQSSRKMQKTAWYDSVEDKYHWILDRNDLWVAGVLDVPACGYSEAGGVCRSSGTSAVFIQSERFFSLGCITALHPVKHLACFLQQIQAY